MDRVWIEYEIPFSASTATAPYILMHFDKRSGLASQSVAGLCNFYPVGFGLIGNFATLFAGIRLPNIRYLPDGTVQTS